MIKATTTSLETKRFFIPTVMVFFLYFNNAEVLKAQTTETIASGSFIINMGQTPQTVNNGLKPYGLLYDLLKNNSVPIKWVINPAKTKDGVDFTHNGVNYAGGTFIIPAGFRTTDVNNRIIFWQGQGVVGATSVAPLTLPVFRTLTAAPRWTLDRDNGNIVTGFFAAAGIPASAYGGSSSNWKLPSQLNACDDVFALPHADPKWATHSNLFNWNNTFKGAIWTGCHAVSALENMYNPANTSQQTNFLTQKVTTAGSQIILPVNGSTNYAQNSLVLWGKHDDGTVPFLTNTGGPQSGTIAPPSDPVSQFIGKPDGAIAAGGSEQIYVPVKGGGWLPSTKIITWDDSPPAKNTAIGINPSVAIAYGRAFGDNNRGLVMYSGGHDNNKGPVADAVAIRRAFFNFAFLSMEDKIVNPAVSGIINGSVVTPGVPVALSVTVPPPATLSGYTFQWSSTCGGTFSPSTTASSITFTPAAVVGSVPCNITVKITDACGRESFSTTSITVVCGLTVGTTLVQPCGASSNGSIAMTISGGSGPYTYTWTRTEGGTGSGSGTTISGLAAGTYSVTVTAANGCANTFSRTVSGGTPGYTYLWTGGATTPNRSGLAAGTYNVTVTDTRGCTGTASAIVTQPAVITATPTITPANCFGQASGTITLVVAGGTAPYSFLWADGATTQNRTGLAAGTYSVVVTDSRGCTLAVNSLAVAQPAAALSLTTSVVNINCNGLNNGSATVTPTGGTAPYTYNWNGTPTGDGTATITGLAAGSYPVTVTDARGCTAVATATITETAPLTVSAAFVRPTCPPGVATLGNDGSITLTVAGGTAPRTYVWTATNGGIIPGGQASNQNLTLLVAGTYSVTITDASGCTATTSVTLTNINPNPVTPGVIKNN
ncbi:MAG: hypothetical protein EAY75_14655 [Bacteroidetes bacterium]|nr:MAG: hypothetical protein EAY75_14655 [Bacteroidota bacterium]